MQQAQRAVEESSKAESTAGKLYLVSDRKDPRETVVRVRVESNGPAVLKFTVTTAA